MSAEPLVSIAAGGELTDDGLAALTSVLMALAVAGQADATSQLTQHNAHRRANWRRLEWHNNYRSPSSWR
jgi:hypothetical protein